MLHPLKLDNQSFKEIYETMSRVMETALSRNKGDASYQDPGHTLMELFALLFDMQHFYMDQVTDEHREKYARLLGYKPSRLICATTMLEISPFGDVTHLSPGYRFYAGSIPFETTEALTLSRNRLEKTEIKTDQDKNVIRLGFAQDLSTHPAGRVYIGFNRAVEPLTYPMDCWKGEYITHDEANREVVMEGKLPRRNISGGFIEFEVDNPMVKEKGLYWFTLTMTSDFEILPSVELVKLNTVAASQKITWCSYTDVTADTDGTFSVSHHLALSQQVEILERTEEGFIELEKNRYELSQNGDCLYCKITQPSYERKYRVLYCDPEYAEKRILSATGAPNQSVPLPAENLRGDRVEIMTLAQGEKKFWKEWTQTDSLYGSQSKSPHFTVKDGTLNFGNHERGEIPGPGIIKIIRCESSLGAGGNIRKSEIKMPPAENIIPSSGGESPRGIYTKPAPLGKAVTLDDYREILQNIPVLELDRIDGEAVTLEKESAVCLYIKPVSDKAQPGLNPAYRANILAYLEPFRLLTTKIVIKPVKYVYFSISVTAELYSEYPEPERMVSDRMGEIFPYRGSINEPRREFGERLTYKEIYSEICKVPCIKRIESLCLYGRDGIPASFIQLNPGELAYLSHVETHPAKK